jgi:hypothetical protein
LRHYNATLTACNALDYHDFISCAVSLLENDTEGKLFIVDFYSDVLGQGSWVWILLAYYFIWIFFLSLKSVPDDLDMCTC